MTEINIAKKWCSKCFKWKIYEDFPKAGGYKSNKNGRRLQCKECEYKRSVKYRLENPERVLEWKHRSSHKIVNGVKNHKKWSLKTEYGLTVDGFVELFKQQDGKCAVCTKGLVLGNNCHVDHDHRTQKVRGLLCNNCNSLLGHSKDSRAVLQAAIDYLDRSSNNGEE